MGTADTWLSLAGLGAFHGLNPGMGWLFAVALGLQRQSRRAVWLSLPPIALGHALAIAASAAIVLTLKLALPEDWLRGVVAGAIGGFALYRAVRRRHLRWAGMCVGAVDLVLWSFLMASAHGAGLMLAPILLGDGVFCGAGVGVAGDTVFATTALGGLLATAVHTAAHLLVSTALAVIVYELVGLRILRHAWFNIDRLWIGILFLTAAVVAIP